MSWDSPLSSYPIRDAATQSWHRHSMASRKLETLHRLESVTAARRSRLTNATNALKKWASSNWYRPRDRMASSSLAISLTRQKVIRKSAKLLINANSRSANKVRACRRPPSRTNRAAAPSRAILRNRTPLPRAMRTASRKYRVICRLSRSWNKPRQTLLTRARE